MLRVMANRFPMTQLLPIALEAALLASSPALGGGPDVNGDGIADLILGMPMETVNGKRTAGYLGIAYGSLVGAGASSQLWSQASPGVAGNVKKGDQFGQMVAAGDFNGDGFDDLAVGAPFEDINQIADGGSVNVLYGSSSGVVAAGSQYIHQDRGLILDQVEANDDFGWALAAGDFNGDGFDDLAVGVPNEDYMGFENTGAIHVFYGSAEGFRGPGGGWYSRSRLGGVNSAGLHLGYALCAGDFNHDGFDDIACGAPGANSMAGEVVVVHGSATGISVATAQSWTQDSPGLPGQAETADSFGMAVAAGDINGDGYSDLAVGVPFDGLNAGAANVIFGSGAGLSATGSSLLSPSALGDPTSGSELSQFGWSLSIGDFNGDGHDDLLVGAPFRRIDAVANAGAVYAVFGASTGLDIAGGIRLSKQNLISGGAAAESDGLGWSLRCGDFNGDGRDDAAIGVPFEDAAAVDSGMLILLPGGDVAFDFAAERALTQESIGMGNTGRVNEVMGFGRGP